MVASISEGSGRPAKQERRRDTPETVARRKANRASEKLRKCRLGILPPIPEQDSPRTKKQTDRLVREQQIAIRIATWKGMIPRTGPATAQHWKYVDYRYWESIACGFDPEYFILVDANGRQTNGPGTPFYEEWEWFHILDSDTRMSLRTSAKAYTRLLREAKAQN